MTTPTNVVKIDQAEGKSFVTDSFTNFAARLGIGADNMISKSSYSFDFLSRNHIQLEAAYRTSWIVGAACDMPAEDMTRAGIKFESEMTPEDSDLLESAMLDLEIWAKLCDTIKWARLFGGAVGLMMIDGQDLKTPLKPERIRLDQFKGIHVLDRWMIWPKLTELDTTLGPNLGKPVFYDILPNGQPFSGETVHHTRLVRMDGFELPYYQRLYENMWGESIIERIHDRLISFDSTSMGIAQLVYKAHLRTYKVENLRDIIATGGKALDALTKQIDMIRLYQSSEGMTLLDAKDEFETYSYTFAGLDDVLLQFGQQLSGALQIPLVRLFGQSPAGMNATGESDLRTYYDHIRKQQEVKLRRPLNVILDVMSRSVLGKELPKGFKYSFNTLWQNTDADKADIAQKNTATALQPFESGLVKGGTVLRELRNQSSASGMWSGISDEEIEEADAMEPPSFNVSDPENMDDPEQQAGDPDAKAKAENE